MNLRASTLAGLSILLVGFGWYWVSKTPPHSSMSDSQTGSVTSERGPLPEPGSPSSPTLPDVAPRLLSSAYDYPTVPDAIDQFQNWADRYRTAKDPAAKAALESEGIGLAKARLTVMADLVQTAPEKAFQYAASFEQRQGLPESVLNWMEQSINAEGDLAVLGVMRDPNQPTSMPGVIRTANIAGEEYQVFVYGAGKRFTTKSGIPLYGLAVPNDASSVPFSTSLGKPSQLLALSESPARWLAPPEQAQKTQQRAAENIADPVCAISKQPVTSKGTPTSFELGGQIHSFCGKVDADLWLKARIAALGLDAATTNLPSLDVAESSYTEGRKKLLLMRPIWSDYKGGMSTNDALTHWRNFSNYMYEMSYGKLVLAALGKGSDITPPMTLPGLVAQYDNTGLDKLYNTCKDVASGTFGYDLAKYDFLYVCTDSKPAASYCGLAFVGGVGFHLANKCWDPAVASHEFGHNLGLNHAHFWDTSLQSTIGDGQNVEYGDGNDPMGGGGSPNQYNSRYKNYLGWIKDTDIVDLNTAKSGTYRLYCFDLNEGSGIRGLKFRRNASQNYWINFRQRKTDKKALVNGVQLLWTGNGNEGSYLLDVRLKGNADDNAVVIGRTFSDPSLDFNFTPIRKANTYPESIDVVVNVGKFPTNLPPVALVTASRLSAGTGQPVTFSVDASDPNGDDLAYFWDFGDGDYSVDNLPTATHSFTAVGEHVVQCTVSDMKGGTARHSLIITVGDPGTFRISGHVVDAANRPLAGIQISAGKDHLVLSDSDGSYVLPGLPAGQYTLTAIEPVAGAFTFSNPYFENPVTVGPNFENADFLGVKGSLTVKTALIPKKAPSWKYLDTGADPGTTWTDPDFDDHKWKVGAAILGYGQGGESTIVSYGPDANNKYPACYFRKPFVIKDPNTFTNYSVEVLRDDGVALYLNGKEFFRNNLPAGDLNYKTWAVDTVEPDSYLLSSISSSDLVAGTNWIAAEVHQATAGSSDLTFDFALSGLSVSNVTGLNISYLTQPVDQSVFESPADILLQNLTHTAGSLSAVSFFADGVKVGESSSSPYETHWQSSAIGEHALFSVAAIGGLQVTSPTVRIRITGTVAHALDIPLLETGSTWHYLSRSTVAPSGWNQLSFDDSSWLSGPAKLGFGHGDEQTVINGGPSNARYPTVYFRQTFIAEDPASLKAVVAQLKRDDGAVIYLNGIEAYRDNMPSGTITFSTLATSATDNGADFHSTTLSDAVRGRIVPGVNLIAVEVHQTSATSSDLAFDFGLTGLADTNRSRGCWIVSPTAGTSIPSSEGVTIQVESVAGGSLGLSKVAFFADDQPIGEDTTWPFAFTWPNPSSGSHRLKAIATDSQGGTIESDSIEIQVAPPAIGSQWISFGDVWRYLDDGSDGGANWYKKSFDDRSWKRGPGKFGYGQPGISTTLNIGTNSSHRYITAYFRKPFVLADLSGVDSLLLQFIRNDGVAVYVNDTLVVRDNLPEGKISYNTLAVTRISLAASTAVQSYSLPAALVQPGTNWISVELHQQSPTSTDGLFDLALTGLQPISNLPKDYLISPAEGAHFNEPATVHLATQVQGASASTRVEYFANDVKVGEQSSAPFAFDWSDPATGSYTLTARITDGAAQRTTPAVHIQVGVAPPPITPVLDRLILAGASWRYWDSVSAVDSAWKSTQFDDSTWKQGNARLGFGLDGEATTLSAGRTTYYFRKAILLDHPEQYEQLVFQLVRDDGAVVYLNGKELYRSNMPAGTITSTTTAVDVVNTPEETQFFETIIDLTGSGIKTGTNIIAVEVHQQLASSSDAAFDLQVLGVGTTESRVTLTSPSANASISQGSPISLEALVNSGSSGVTVDRVQFLANGTSIGEVTTAPWVFTWLDADQGSQLLQAKAWLSNGQTQNSDSLKVTVTPPQISVQLIASNAVWNYFDLGQNLGTTWRNLNYDDSSWKNGPARLGYGEDGESTTVGFGPDPNNRYVTTYFRNTFTVSTDSVFTNLVFRYQRDDGIAVYLNGKEMFRNNLASGAVYNTLASASVDGIDEQTWYTTNLTVTALPAGNNVVAAEVHQRTVSSADLGFALALEGKGYSKATPPVRPRLTAEVLSDGTVRISWPTTANYLPYSSSLAEAPAANWQLISKPIQSNGGISFVDLGSASLNQLFIRLQAAQAP